MTIYDQEMIRFRNGRYKNMIRAHRIYTARLQT